MLTPITDLKKRRINKTLHGRSVYRPKNVSGHNVFMGYSSPGTGDALDLFAAGGTEVYAPFDGVQTRWLHDTEKIEVIYLERADGAIAVLAHINAYHEGTGIKVKAGEVVGWVRKDLKDPHLHFELKMPKDGGYSLAGKTPATLRKKLMQLCGMVV